MAAIRSWWVSSGVKMPLLRPSRSTTMRSATARTSSMLWEMTMTARPFCAHALDEVQHLRRLRDAERRRGLVEHDELGLEQQRAGDGDGLALPARERRDGLAHRGDAGGELVQERPGADLHRHLVKLPRVLPRGRDRCWPPRRDFRRARGPGTPWRCRGRARREGESSATSLAHEADRAGRRLVHAREHLDEGGLARAVVAHQRDHLARVDVELDVGQRRDGAEVLGHVAERDDGLAAGGRRGSVEHGRASRAAR